MYISLLDSDSVGQERCPFHLPSIIILLSIVRTKRMVIMAQLIESIVTPFSLSGIKNNWSRWNLLVGRYRGPIDTHKSVSSCWGCIYLCLDQKKVDSKRMWMFPSFFSDINHSTISWNPWWRKSMKSINELTKKIRNSKPVARYTETIIFSKMHRPNTFINFIRLQFKVNAFQTIFTNSCFCNAVNNFACILW